MFSLIVASSLEKVLPDATLSAVEKTEYTALQGENVSFQFVYANESDGIFKFRIDTDDEVEAKAYFVKNVPVDYASHPRAYGDTNYISHKPGMYPDALIPVDRDWVYVNNIYHSIWVSLKGKSGTHSVKITFYDENGNEVATKEVKVEILTPELPEQKLKFTQWFHVDCIADWYNYEIFSEELWLMLEKYLRMACESGINMILTPIFTPALDTAVDTERPTVQLVGIKKTDKGYEFDFELLHRWIELCKKVGFKYFEMPHLFTQWGAKATPKIVADVNGTMTNIFGWHVLAEAPEYEEFLSVFIPALKQELKKEGIFENTYFHISDEPTQDKYENYCRAKSIASKYLKDCKIIDAISESKSYDRNKNEIPVLATDYIHNFDLSEMGERWCYYCNGQCINVSNRFIAMPSSRNRSIAVQLYKFSINGFLQWGYNFYYSRFSLLKIDPFNDTCAYGAFPGGDAFSVYPGKNGPMPAISLLIFKEALQDLSALQLLEQKIGFCKTVEYIEEILGSEIQFDKCFSADMLIKMREAVNLKIKELFK